MQVIPHLAYSPDLAPADYFLFDRIKSQIRGHRHQTVNDMQTAVFRSLKAIPVQEFHDAMNLLPLRWMKCIKSRGNYFEGHHVVVDPGDFGLEQYSGEDSDQDTSEDEQ